MQGFFLSVEIADFAHISQQRLQQTADFVASAGVKLRWSSTPSAPSEIRDLLHAFYIFLSQKPTQWNHKSFHSCVEVSAILIQILNRFPTGGKMKLWSDL